MRLTRVFGEKNRRVRILKPSTLYAFSTKRVLEMVRNGIVDRIEAGEDFSDSEVRAVIEIAKAGRKELKLPDWKSPPSTPPKPTESFAQTRAKAIIAFSTLLHRRLVETLDDLTRIVGDEQRRIRDIPLHKRVVLARGYLHALGITVADLEPIDDES
jgi:hypothetical protein